jgi:hypothetical protein
MKTIFTTDRSFSNCEGVSRRDFVKVGSLAMLGLSLPDFFRMKAASANQSAKAKSVIFIWLAGGPSHIDSWDPKPDSLDTKGEFKPISTSVPGVQISEHLPNVAKVMDKAALIRSMTSPEGAHERASRYLNTGYRPLPTLQYPSYGSWVAKEKGAPTGLPAYVQFGNLQNGAEPGFLGEAYSAFGGGNPSQPNYRVRDLIPSVTLDRINRRRQALAELDDKFEKSRPEEKLSAMDKFYEKAYDIIHSPAAQKAFNIQSEPSHVREEYGMTPVGQSALMARRLVEAGVPFVSVSFGGWDTHQQNFPRLSGNLLPPLDKAVAALISDLHQRGMLDSTLVVVTGEFGRTPRINPNAGRDHWPNVWTLMMAGGGVRGGAVVGASDDKGAFVKDRPVKPEDFAATLYTVLGIDYNKEFHTSLGRPIRFVTGGTPVRELLENV